MKKLYISLAILFATLIGLMPNAFAQEKAVQEEVSAVETPADQTPAVDVPAIDILATMNQQSDSPNRIWVGHFQIVWNEFMDNLVYGPIDFADYNSKMAKELNKQNFKKTDISENSYYTKYGLVSPNLKQTIEQGIKDKFNETSDILDQFDWTYRPDKLFVYAMLKKRF